MTEQPTKSIRWYSTVESAENLEISVLAVLESICAVSLSLWLAWHFQSYSHIVVAIVLAPLLLLRTEESTRLGLVWFGNLSGKIDIKNQFLLLSAIGLILISIAILFIVPLYTYLIISIIFIVSWLAIVNLVKSIDKLEKTETQLKTKYDEGNKFSEVFIAAPAQIKLLVLSIIFTIFFITITVKTIILTTVTVGLTGTLTTIVQRHSIILE